jgi:hypothetical protein
MAMDWHNYQPAPAAATTSWMQLSLKWGGPGEADGWAL